jgi:hypothetical protein
MEDRDSSAAPCAPSAASADPDARGVAPLPAPGVHVQQQLTWDCGLACAEMALRLLGLWREGRHSQLALRALVASPCNSVWTIDVCLMLRALGARALTLHTLVAGVDPSHAALAYYAGAALGARGGEGERITAAFAQAAALGLPVRAPSALPAAHLAERLQRRSHAYIALVDLRLMQCEACGEGHSPTELARLARPHEYWGHYVLLYGCDAASGRVSYLDPSALASPRGCAMAGAALHAARCAQGTDQDLIEIELPAAPRSSD